MVSFQVLKRKAATSLKIKTILTFLNRYHVIIVVGFIVRNYLFNFMERGLIL